MIAFIGFILAVLGVYLIKKGRKMRLECEEYEFKNRTKGGVIQFNDFRASKEHEQKRNWADLFPKLGLLAFIFAFLFFMGAYGCH
ncbi:MAG: hypothetical protein JST94_10765 [Bacteroidetes bacterium]|nr:hypothetical protein [Bacteroidota bacterium]MBS1671910.1 hypothetical protein [Bacteroidota bacterium]